MMRWALSATAALLACACAMGAAWIWDDVSVVCADPVDLLLGNADGAQLDNLAVAPDGSVHIVWTEYSHAPEDDSDNRKIFYNAKPAYGAWDPLGKTLAVRGGIFLETTEGATHPSLICAPDGTLHMVWHDYRDSCPCPDPPGWPHLNVEIMYKSKPATLTPWDLFADEYVTDWPNTEEGGTLGDNRYMACLGLDPSGWLHAVYIDYHWNGWAPSLSHSQAEASSPVWPTQDYDRVTDASGQYLPYPCPSVAFDSGSRLHIVSCGIWNAGDANGGCYYIAQDGAGGWTSPLRISDDVRVVSPKIAIDGNDILHVVWAETDAYGNWDVKYTSAPVGGAWPAPVQLDSDDDARLPDIAVDSEGGIHITYQTDLWSGSRIAYRYLAPGAGEFTEAAAVSEDGDAAFCSLAVDGTDALHCAWSAEGGAELQYRCARRLVDSAGILSAGWNMLSVPLIPADPSVEAVFADAVAAGNTLTGGIYSYTPGAGYGVYPIDFTQVEVGRGYWVLLQNGCVNAVEGFRTYTPARVPLAHGWNLIGHPRDAGVRWADCRVSDGATELSLEDAAAAAWLQETAYYYDGSYRTLRVSGGDDDVLRPWRAYWVLAYTDGLELLIPAP